MSQHGLRLGAIAFTLAIATPWGTAQADEQGPWGAIVKLRDDTNTYAAGKPSGGWYVAPIHATLRASDGKIVVTGTGRPAESNCAGNTQRKYPMTFVVDPEQIDALDDGATLLIQPIDEQSKDPTHQVLYCSGHTPLADGRIFFCGGTDYPNTLPQVLPELGLNYARVFDPKVNRFNRIESPMGGGQAATPGMKWYPSNLRLPDGRILTIGGFHWSAGGQGDRSNRSLEVFDPKVWDADPKANPFTVLTQHSEVSTNYHASGRGFVNLFLLPKPVPAASGGGFARAVVFAGNQGQPFLYNYEPGPTGPQRLLARTVTPNTSSFEKAEGSSGVLLPDGRLMFANGGHDGMGAQRAYFYDPMADNWTTLDLGISRIYSTATWLPNGTVLVVNGYTSEPGSANDVSNPLGGPDGARKPQIIDPFVRTFETGNAWPEPTSRGFHSFALLLKDGRILIGGGKDPSHDTGCEKNELRIYSPPYLSAGPRPAITNVQEGQALVIGQRVTLNYTGTVRAVRGVALLAPASVTHSFNQGQRYVPLTATAAPSGGSITALLPSTINEAPPGDYLLYVVSDMGVPSVGVHVRVGAPSDCLYTIASNADAFIEAESFARSAGPFRTVADPTRSSGSYVEVDPASESVTKVPDEGKAMWYDLDVKSGGSVSVWMLGRGPAPDSKGVFLSMDANADEIVQLPAEWGWVKSTTAFSLSSGRHTLKIKAGDHGAQIDSMRITTSASTTPPSGLGGPPLAPACTVKPMNQTGADGGVLAQPSDGGPGASSDPSDHPLFSEGGTSPQPSDGPADGSVSSANPDGSSGCGCSLKRRRVASPAVALALGLVMISWARRSRTAQSSAKRSVGGGSS